MVIGLDPEGPAAKAGVQQGDIILAFDGNATASVRDLAAMLHNADLAKPASLDISRSTRNMKVSVTLAERQ